MSSSSNIPVFASLICGAVILSGCVSFTESRIPSPDLGVPKAPVKFLNDELGDNDGAVPSTTEWWQIYNDPTLESLIQRLETANPDLEAALARRDRSFAVLGITRTSLLPAIDGELSAGRRRDSLNNLLFPISTSEYDHYLIGVSASWELDLWGRVRAMVKRDRFSAQSTEFNFQDLRLSLQANLARQYFAARTAQVELGILQDALQIREENLMIQESRLRLGTGVEVDVARAKVEFHNARAAQESAIRNLGKVRHSIAVLIGIAPIDFDKEFPLNDKTSFRLPRIVAGLPSSLLKRRADLRAADRTLRSAAAQLGIRQADFLPKITLNGTGGRASLSADNLFNPDSALFDIGPRVSFPIFRGRIRKFALAQTQANWREASANYKGAFLTAIREVEDALLNLQSLTRESKALHEAGKAANQAAVAARKRHDSGLASYFEFIDAERDRLRVRLAENILLGEQQATSVSLVQALGGSW
jgi:multidrug efflux system outer membrane protein